MVYCQKIIPAKIAMWKFQIRIQDLTNIDQLQPQQYAPVLESDAGSNPGYHEMTVVCLAGLVQSEQDGEMELM